MFYYMPDSYPFPVPLAIPYKGHNYDSTNDMWGATEMRYEKKGENENKLENVCRADFPRNKPANSPKFLQSSKDLKIHFKCKVLRTLMAESLGECFYLNERN
jgi:hypothetical protein